MSSKAQAVLALVCITLVWICGHFIYRAVRDVPDINDPLVTIMESDAFRMSLQDEVPDGCVAMSYQDPDIIFVGSSHAYAALDPHILQNALPKDDVAVCALRLWNLDFMGPFIKSLDTNSINPKMIVWLVDPASMRRLPSADSALTFAEEVFRGDHSAKTVHDWTSTFGSDQDLDQWADNHLHLEAIHRDSLTGLDANVVEDRIAASKTPLDHLARTALERGTDVTDVDRKFYMLCQALGAKDIEFNVILTPTNTLTDLRFTSSLNDRLSEIKEHALCAKHVTAKSLAQWGLDDRYYLNREIDPDYDYSLWSGDPGRLEAHIADMTDRQRVGLYDNHLNPIGSVIFSEEVAALVKTDFR